MKIFADTSKKPLKIEIKLFPQCAIPHENQSQPQIPREWLQHARGISFPTPCPTSPATSSPPGAQPAEAFPEVCYLTQKLELVPNIPWMIATRVGYIPSGILCNISLPQAHN